VLKEGANIATSLSVRCFKAAMAEKRRGAGSPPILSDLALNQQRIHRNPPPRAFISPESQVIMQDQNPEKKPSKSRRPNPAHLAKADEG
jgi:hypothetical protein